MFFFADAILGTSTSTIVILGRRQGRRAEPEVYGPK